MDSGILQYGVLPGTRRSWFPRHDSLRITYVVFRRSYFLVMQRGPSTRSYCSPSGFRLGLGTLFAGGVREEGGTGGRGAQAAVVSSGVILPRLQDSGEEFETRSRATVCSSG
jgi:hypothetical protein